MGSFIRVCALSDLPKGSRRTVELEGRAVALFHLDEGLHAIDNTCPHRGGPLGEGDLQGCLVYCPLHAWCFDLRTGNSPVYPMARVARYEVRVEGGDVWVSSEGRLPPFPEVE